jgi:hypothetical protein
MRGAFGFALCCALLRASALAQIDPDDTGEGTRLGLAQQNNSGQVGTVELLANGSEATLVIVRVFSAPSQLAERARIALARSCDDPHARPALDLTPVRGGRSRSVVALSAKRLLTERAIVEVFGPGRRRMRVSCGELRR